MSSFDATNKRLKNIRGRIPDFPEDLVRLMRMTYHVQKQMKDLSNAVLRKYDLVDASYMVLAVLYGSDGETSTASTLGEACMEKPANLTRVCNDLEGQGLIQRGNRPGDRRCVMISLTDAGRKIVEQVMPEVWDRTTRAYDGFSADDLRQQEQLFKRQLDNLENNL
ncbi:MULTISPECIES: MarR family winged helix-turn-helix transcriptional regulator [unclassified Massilia]|uniref:MarR family winged helix-turn-helix transcriptional regulator n=1 Tax=unclassified Massilia TaxID=2609279 RepID=UPI00067E1F7C|nr:MULTISPECIES: MarR family transcriptional regulator [unclassified Massilia]AKU22067.1 MarR family transcriptional regulator [Massilia sp. NR 4-1]UMR33196.1 MarR family transcriptional regulator [Massilia sp. MB5]UTY55823.1 MarR family transcriptional regulator [Massilia sp. erpn]